MNYDVETKNFIATVLHLPLEKVTNELCYYIETNYYNFWYYFVDDNNYNDDFKQFNGIEYEIKVHALPLVNDDDTYVNMSYDEIIK